VNFYYDLFVETGKLAEVDAAVIKKVIAWQILEKWLLRR